MICPNCRKEYNDRQKYCISCGCALVTSNEAYSILTGGKEESDGAETEEPPSDERNPSDKRSAPNSLIPDETFGLSESEPEDAREEAEDEVIAVAVNSQGEKSIHRLLKGAGSLIAAVVLTALVMAGTGSYVLRSLTSPDNIEHIIGDTDIMRLSAGDVNFFPPERVPNDSTLLDAFYLMTSNSGLSKEDIREIYETSTFKDFFIEYLVEGAEYIRTGREPRELSADRIKALFSENIAVINDKLDVSLSQSDIDGAFSEIDKSEEVWQAISITNAGSGELSRAVGLLRTYISAPVIAVEAVLALLAAAFIIAINKKNASGALRWCGAGLFFPGAAILIFTFLVSMRVIFAGIENEFMKETIFASFNVISPIIYRICGTIAGLGALALLLSPVFKKNGAKTEYAGTQLKNI